MTDRREFPKRVAAEIIKRATINGVIVCEQCRQPASRFHVDHIVADALVIDKSKRLTAAEGQLLCAGSPESCHGKKTALSDVPAIAEAVRREISHLGADKHASTKARGFPPPAKAKRPPRAPVHGVTGIARQYVRAK